MGIETNAGGATTEELVISLVTAVLFLIGLAGLVVAHRRGKLDALDRAADRWGRIMHQPGWAALPLSMAGFSLLVAVFGFYWDVGTHIDHGRDEGVFGNAAHWPILVGLAGIAIAGLVSMMLGTDEERAGGLRVPGGRWHTVPIGGALLFLCGLIALAGFPIDDIWHRIFGQDVTLWSPPHIQMVLGASLCTVAMLVLFVEAERTRGGRREGRHWIAEAQLAGAVLIGMSTLQGEFDFGVPQFRLLFQPLLIAVAAGIALVVARVRLGRGGAFVAVGFFLAVRGILTLVVSGLFDHVTFHMPLYLGAALAVELVALVVPTDRQLSFGAASGLAIGTLGLAIEALWTQIWMPIAWTTAMLPEAALLAVPTAVAAGVVGGFLARSLTRQGTARQQVPALLAPVAAVTLVAAIAYPLATVGTDARASMQLTPVDGPTAGDHVEVTLTVDPPGIEEGAEWFNIIAWQGASWWSEEAMRLQELEPLGDGVYRSTEPVPVDGEWKAMVRLHQGRTMVAAPIFLPEDLGIPVEEVPAEAEMTREFVPDHEVLLREMRDVPGWVVRAGQGLMVLIGLAWLAAFVAGSRQLRRNRPDVEAAGSGTSTVHRASPPAPDTGQDSEVDAVAGAGVSDAPGVGQGRPDATRR